MISKSLIEWYDLNKKNMPWRKNQDSYRIWISEAMLQQTQVSTVIPYYEQWMRKFPNIQSVALANIDDILKLWEGLGYYRRAHHIKKSCDIVMNHFGIQKYADQIRKLLLGKINIRYSKSAT